MSSVGVYVSCEMMNDQVSPQCLIVKLILAVNRIASIYILTTTRHLYLEDAPEVFEILAYDEEGNAFSSLDGEIKWQGK